MPIDLDAMDAAELRQLLVDVAKSLSERPAEKAPALRKVLCYGMYLHAGVGDCTAERYVRLPDGRTGEARELATSREEERWVPTYGELVEVYGALPVGTVVLGVLRLRVPGTHVAPVFAGGIVVSEDEPVEGSGGGPVKWGLPTAFCSGEVAVQARGRWTSVGYPPERLPPPQVAPSEGKPTQ